VVRASRVVRVAAAKSIAEVIKCSRDSGWPFVVNYPEQSGSMSSVGRASPVTGRTGGWGWLCPAATLGQE
jgi:hypothetical protein